MSIRVAFLAGLLSAAPLVGLSAATSRGRGGLQVSDAELRALRERGYGWGDIGRALVIADQSGRKLGEIASLRDSGLGWTEIGDRYGVDMPAESAAKAKRRGRGEPDARDAPASGTPNYRAPSHPRTSPGGQAPPPNLPGADGGPPGAGNPGGSPGTTNPTPQPGASPSVPW